LSCARVDMHAVGVMNKNDRLYLTKAALARAAGLDPRSKDIKKLEPDAHLVTTQNKRVALYASALADVLKAKTERN
jgi:G3E family GTPase